MLGHALGAGHTVSRRGDSLINARTAKYAWLVATVQMRASRKNFLRKVRSRLEQRCQRNLTVTPLTATERSMPTRVPESSRITPFVFRRRMPAAPPAKAPPAPIAL